MSDFSLSDMPEPERPTRRDAASATPLFPRPLSPGELPALFALLQKVHRRDTLESYPAEYPLMLSSENAPQLCVVPGPSGYLLCHVGAIHRELLLGTLRLPVALVGSVATLPEARGTGLAGAALSRVHQQLRQQGCLLSFLWSDPRALYARAGYHELGCSYTLAVPSGQPEEPWEAVQVGPCSPAEAAPLLPALLTRSDCLARSQEEHQQLSTIPGVECWRAVRDQKSALLYIGKGSDLRNIAHDWVGEPDLILDATQAIRALRPGPLELLVPGPPHPVLSLAKARGWASSLLPVAMGCVLAPQALLEALAPLLPPPTLRTLRRIPWNAEGISPVPKVPPLARVLFGPCHPLQLPGLPLPFFIWGLDSM